MKIQKHFQQWLLQEDLNFLLTNRIPRITLTRFMGWWSQIRNPWVAKASIAVWRLFTDLDLSEAREKQFASLHACFTRELVPGARPVDPDQPDLFVDADDDPPAAADEPPLDEAPAGTVDLMANLKGSIQEAKKGSRAARHHLFSEDTK